MSLAPNIKGISGTVAPNPKDKNDEIAATFADGKSFEVTPNSSEEWALINASEFILNSRENCNATSLETPRSIHTWANSFISSSRFSVISFFSN